jgi:hypothetical protein
MDPTEASLAPLLQGTAGTRDEIWACLDLHRGFISARVRGTAGSTHHDDAYQAVLLGICNRALRGGLPFAPPLRNPSGWFSTVVKSKAVDWLRRKQRAEKPTPAPRRKRPKRTRPDPDTWYAQLDDRQRGRVDNLVRSPLRTGISPVQVLVWMLCFVPAHLVPHLDALVAAAAAYVPPSGSRSTLGLSRTAHDTVSLLQAWQTTHDDDPRAPAATQELAWILRGDPGGSEGAEHAPKAWRAQVGPRGFSRARDVIYKWRNRAAHELKLPGKAGR